MINVNRSIKLPITPFSIHLLRLLRYYRFFNNFRRYRRRAFGDGFHAAGHAIGGGDEFKSAAVHAPNYPCALRQVGHVRMKIQREAVADCCDRGSVDRNCRIVRKAVTKSTRKRIKIKNAQPKPRTKNAVPSLNCCKK